MSLDVGLLVFVPLCDGALGYRTLGERTLGHWSMALDIRVLWAGLLVCHFLLLSIAALNARL